MVKNVKTLIRIYMKILKNKLQSLKKAVKEKYEVSYQLDI